MIKNRYGYLTEDSREFVITDPRTPRPWFNYMWNEHYAGLVSHTGGGYSFLDSPRDNRITRMRYNCLPWDRPGRYVVIKDIDRGTYWSLSWAPTINLSYDRYECHHGQGYTRIITEFNGILAEITYYVPRDLLGEIWRVSLTDLTGKMRRLEIYSFTELLMGNALNDIINQPNDQHFSEVRFSKNHGSLEATRRYWVLNKKVSVIQPNLAWGHVVYFTQTLPITGFDGSLGGFIGRWRSEANPESIETGKMNNTEITAGDPLAALQSRVSLPANGSLDFATILAVVPKGTEKPYDYLRWSELTDVGILDEKFNEVQDYWNRYLGTVQVDTPDKSFNAMLNVWNQYQSAVTFDMARNAGYYHGGLLFGTGMRDQFQDILGVVMVEPSRVRARLLNALRYQFNDGSTLHNFFKLTDTGERTNHSDTPLWIPFGIVEYLNETGDLSILDESVSYYDSTEGTVYEHMIRAIDFALSNLSDRGLPRIMNGDWNDTLDQIGPKGKGETVWGGFFLGYILKKISELLEIRNDQVVLDRYKTAYGKLGEVINEFCWDDEWYIRAFRDDGTPVGTAGHKQGRIFLNSQTWAVISGLATEQRGDKAMESCKKYLAKPNGIQICWPSYTEVEEDVGLISRCVPGKKENGAVFNHASSWYILAALLNGDADFAFDIYSRMIPLNIAARDIDRYEVEPYVYAEYVTSPDHPTEGQASHSWLTGTSVWMLRIGLDHILGIRPAIKGIVIDPNIPSAWKQFSLRRVFRGKTIFLSVSNPDGRNRGVKRLTVNNIESDSTLIDVSKYSESKIFVDVVLG